VVRKGEIKFRQLLCAILDFLLPPLVLLILYVKLVRRTGSEWFVSAP
jgi:hypothetical protein